MHLYELTEAIRRLEDMEGEDFNKALSDLGISFESTAEDIAKYIRELEAEATAYKDEAAKLSAVATARLNKVQGLKGYLKLNMESLGLTQVGTLVKVKLQDSPPSCIIVNEEEVPLNFKERVETWNIDKKGIIQYWKDGEAIPGTTVQVGKHVRIYP